MAEDVEPIKGVSFSDPAAAARFRAAIQKAAVKEIEKASPNGQIARVMSVDIAKLTASVWYPGDDGPVTVNMFKGAIPLDLGDYRGTTVQETSTVGTGGLVWVENWRGQPYITKIISGGEFTLDQRVAGLTHQSFRATRQGTLTGSPIAGIYERHVNIELNGGQDFTVGKCMLVGPWSGKNDGSSVDGIIELVLSFWVSGSIKNQVRKYQFSVSDRMIVDLEGDEGNKAFWMRLLPETNLGTNPHAELAVDVALVKTGIRTNLEFWFRLVPLDNLADQSVYFMSVKTFGSAFNVGDPKTGRVVAILQDTVEPVQGFVGFHNAGMGWTERDEIVAFPWGTYYQGDEWSSGSWRSAALRAATDLRPLWRTTGQWIYGQDNKLNWEGNIVFTGIGPNWNALHTGQISVPFPDNSIPVFPSDQSNFSTQLRSISGGIQFNEGDVLYYSLVPGAGTGGQGSWQPLNRHFFLVDSKTYNASQKNFGLPEWAIPICGRSYATATESSEFYVFNTSSSVKLDDRTTYTESSYSTQQAGIAGNTEVEVMDVPSFRFKKKTTYRVKIFTQFFSATVNQAIYWRLRKGTTVAGANILGISRSTLGNSTGSFVFECEVYITNDTTSDITTAIVLTGQNNSASTWTRNGTTAERSYMRIDEWGPAAKYAFHSGLLT